MNTHPTRDEDFDLYALGVLEGQERDAIESHVAACAACSEKLAQARGRMALLALTAPPFSPSPGVKERLMRQLHATAAGSGPVQPPLEPRRGIFANWWTALLAPVAAVAALAAMFLATENIRMNKQLAADRAAMDQQQKELAQATNLAHFYESKDTVKVALAPKQGMPNGSMRIMYNAKMGMLMCDGWVEPAPAKKNYQLWVVPMEGKPINAGLLTSPSGNIDNWMTTIPEGVAAKAFAVTLEPEGGMPEPTGPMVMAGPAS